MELDEPIPRPIVPVTGDSDLRVVLHPLPLMCISDYIVRHTLRKQTGAVVGALFGQQHGHETTIEVAFEAKTQVRRTEAGDVVDLDEDWLEQRIHQMREVHKARNLDLVGWFTLSKPSSLNHDILPINARIAQACGGTVGLLLCFHPSEVISRQESAMGRLPLTLYQWEYNLDSQGSGTEGITSANTTIPHFRQVEYTVETGEAEMIGLSYVASGGANAVAAGSHGGAGLASAAGGGYYTSREDDELIAAMTAKSNAIKMLRSRITLLYKYLQQLDISSKTNHSTASCAPAPQINHTILRAIGAATHQLNLLVPSDLASFNRELASETNDVAIVTLLNELTHSVTTSRQVGRMAAVVESAKLAKARPEMGYRDRNTAATDEGLDV